MLKAWGFTKNRLCHRYFGNNLQKIFQAIILQNVTEQILLLVVLTSGLWLNIQMEIADENDSIFTCLPSLHIVVWILRTVMCQSEEAHPRLSQASKINLSTRIVNVFKLTLLTIFAKLLSWMLEEHWLHLQAVLTNGIN